ncbi:MAG TPA: hypothetical protein VKA17_03345 [Gammaproteobacteria bacterium]|nr:hypothetical protein [Gammaproteobacteria bacterium]
MSTLRQRLKRSYVAVMMRIVGWGLRAMSRVDPVVRAEAAGFPDNIVIAMTTLPDGPGMVLQKTPDGRLRYLGSQLPPGTGLAIRFKHLDYAFRVFAFVESTPTAFARARMVVDGDLASGIRLVRCMYRLEAVLMPRFIAARGVKRYPQDLGLGEKLGMNAKIYGRIALDLATRS